MNIEDLDALESLLAFQEKEGQVSEIADELVCECYCVALHDIQEAIKESNLLERDDEQLKSFLTQKFGMGGGCSQCLKSFETWKHKILNT